MRYREVSLLFFPMVSFLSWQRECRLWSFTLPGTKSVCRFGYIQLSSEFNSIGALFLSSAPPRLTYQILVEENCQVKITFFVCVFDTLRVTNKIFWAIMLIKFWLLSPFPRKISLVSSGTCFYLTVLSLGCCLSLLPKEGLVLSGIYFRFVHIHCSWWHSREACFYFTQYFLVSMGARDFHMNSVTIFILRLAFLSLTVSPYLPEVDRSLK